MTKVYFKVSSSCLCHENRAIWLSLIGATRITYRAADIRAKGAASLMWTKYRVWNSVVTVYWLMCFSCSHVCLSRQTNVGCLIKTQREKNIDMAQNPSDIIHFL